MNKMAKMCIITILIKNKNDMKLMNQYKSVIKRRETKYNEKW